MDSDDLTSSILFYNELNQARSESIENNKGGGVDIQAIWDKVNSIK
jgi:hypothetical protein